MKKDFTDITVVLDRSGSMASILSDTIGGFNTFLEEQKKVSGTATFSLVQFDHCPPNPFCEYTQNNVDIQKANKLNTENYVPRGGTPLLDALGETLIKTGKKLEAISESDRPEKVVFVVITDGQENSSHEFTQSQIKAMVEKQTNIYKWEFLFLGANIDAISTGAGLGIAMANSMNYAATHKGVTAAFAAAATNMSNYRTGVAVSMAVDDKQRESAK